MMAPYDLGGPVSAFVLFTSAMVLQPMMFAVPCYLLARRQPRREPHALRAALVAAALLAYNAVANLAAVAGMTGAFPGAHRYLVNFVTYSLYLVLLVPAVLACFETSIWNALFCATAAYTIQNLGSGLGETVRIVLADVLGLAIPLAAAALLSDLCIVAVIALYYRPFIRHVESIGRLGGESRGMLGMLVLVILVVIAYDVLIRGLGQHGTAVGFLLALRMVHGAVCVFVLFAEYEMLFNARLQRERETTRRLAAERERQYELSRETIAAVNRRVHDIRHKVMEDLSAGDAQVSREVLAEVAHDIAVYDTQVKTGNDVLDTILTEKGLLCQQRGVTLGCIADGAAVATLPTPELYALVSSALDGAIDDVCRQCDPSRRSVSLTLRQVGSLALMHVEHYGEGGASTAAQLREVVERLGGTLATSSGGGATSFDVMLPVADRTAVSVHFPV